VEGPVVDRNVCVLVVDDDKQVLEVYSRVLARASYRCIKCQTGSEALERLLSEQVDVVVTDLSMPGMSGVDFMRRARERNPDLPIMVMTGAPAVDSAIQSIDVGVFRYLTKPMLPAQLVKAVGDAVHSCALAQARRAAYVHLIGQESAASDAPAVARALETMWLAVQPIASTVDRRVVAYEALLRTKDPVLSDPGKVLAAAERLNLLASVGRSVRDAAARLTSELPDSVDLFINVHPVDLLDEQLFARTAPLSVVARRIVLEVTERASLDTIPDARVRIGTLRDMGYRIALDDMGAGYAGLSSFAMLQPDFVKLDMALVRDVDSDPVKQTLIRTLLGLARELGIEVIAEGVETPAERESLASMGCTKQQGYLFARPGRPFPSVSW
jgi:EAL domain-containing protein (putative c-di-GMP-specific phosphodiesterase class I)